MAGAVPVGRPATQLRELRCDRGLAARDGGGVHQHPDPGQLRSVIGRPWSWPAPSPAPGTRRTRWPGWAAAPWPPVTPRRPRSSCGRHWRSSGGSGPARRDPEPERPAPPPRDQHVRLAAERHLPSGPLSANAPTGKCATSGQAEVLAARVVRRRPVNLRQASGTSRSAGHPAALKHRRAPDQASRPREVPPGRSGEIFVVACRGPPAGSD